ncbi:MAG: TaqI-like C-terminal specificity domain-containing protein [Prolixibacteraceae bacterium]|jgi:hypothetical protein|nr:TaqI-like C-terminal specificity domain-containing protein [Prolixibacteraceae bacterium]
MLQQCIFGDRNYKQKLANFSIDDISELNAKTGIISKYIKALESGWIERTKEEAIQADFLNKFFGDVLGYDYNDPALWNLEKEYKSVTDSTKADGALGFFSLDGTTVVFDVRAVIELKDAFTDLDKPQNRQSDKRTPVEQVFSYSSKAGGNCKWVIVSNFKEIRLYHASDQSRYENFFLYDLLLPDNLKRFFFLLQKERLISKKSESLVDVLYRERQEAEQIISRQFYNQYKNLRIELLGHLKQNNPGKDELSLLNKSQKILDRFIFVCFCEDKNLLPAYTSKKVKDILINAFDFEPNKLWRQLKGLFQSIDIGNPPLDINKFDGGLFAKDDELDNLIINDKILLELIKLSDYDFDSDLNVNILGHIFEQSLSDIEELKAQIGNGKELTDEQKSDVRKNGKRKKDGIFYTPEYVTRYIVKEAIGSWLDDRKRELGYYNLTELTADDIASIKPENKKGNKLKFNRNVETWLTFWESYKELLRNIKVLDPACGSGAFLNQAFDYLYAEGRKVSEEIARLKLGQREAFELDRHILTNNIYGVDLNPESVEITKLSLWLKTANKGKELTALDENIKCGNSLIDDPMVAGEKAFNWFRSFPSVFPHHYQRSQKEENTFEEPAYNYSNPQSKGYERYGFDVIIGNPPYIPAEEIPHEHKEYYPGVYKSAFGRLNVYPIFYEKAISLLKKNGYVGFITPYTISKNKYYLEARKVIIDNTWLKQIVDFQNFKVFEDATVDSIILILNKIENEDRNVCLIDNIVSFTNQDYRTTFFKQAEIRKNEDLSFITANSDFFQKLYLNSKKVSQVINFNQGIITGNNKLFVSKTKSENSKPIITGSDFNRYFLSYSDLYIDYSEKLHRPRTKTIFEIKEKILLRQTGSYPICTIDSNGFYTLDTVHNGLVIDPNFDIKYLLCLLNSKLLRYIYNSQIKETGKVFAQVKIMYIDELPIKDISKEEQGTFIAKAGIMLNNNVLLVELKNKFVQLIRSKWANLKITSKLNDWYNLTFEEFRKELEKQKVKLTLQEQSEWLQYFNEQKQKARQIQEIINQTDKEIDNLVYQLYELTENEKMIVGGCR